MFEYDFMVNAFAAATVVALVCGLVGTMLVLRGQAFAGHALGHVGFAGATGAVLVGASPLWGLVLVTVAGGACMGALGRRLQEADVAIGVVLSLALGLGLLFRDRPVHNPADTRLRVLGLGAHLQALA